MSQAKDTGGDKPPTWTISSGQDFGRAVADIRTLRGLTQQQLAGQTGLSRAYLAQIESGRSVSLLEHMLRILRRSGATVTVTLKSDDGKT